VSSGTDIKLMNILNGEYVGEIDGAHFKGTLNMGLISDEGPTSKLSQILTQVKNKVLTGDAFKTDVDIGDETDPLIEEFVQQMNHYLFFTVSSKEKLKMWKFEDGIPKLAGQDIAFGGNSGNTFSFARTRNKELIVVVTGQTSNKVELFSL
jgi:hypothetical protein